MDYGVYSPRHLLYKIYILFLLMDVYITKLFFSFRGLRLYMSVIYVISLHYEECFNIFFLMENWDLCLSVYLKIKADNCWIPQMWRHIATSQKLIAVTCRKPLLLVVKSTFLWSNEINYCCYILLSFVGDSFSPLI